MGLSEPHRVGQAMEVKILLLDSAPMQIDGEPWEQHPAEINLSHQGQVRDTALGVVTWLCSGPCANGQRRSLEILMSYKFC